MRIPPAPSSHRRLNCALHGTPKCHPPLQLLRNGLRHQLSIELRLPDLNDVDHHVRFGEIGDLPAQFFDIGAFLADDHAGPGGLHRDPTLLVRPLDHDLRYRRLLEVLHQLLADLHVLMQQLSVLALAGVPARVPGAVYAKPQADWIDFLTHASVPYEASAVDVAGSPSRTTMVRFANGLKIRPIRPRPRG